MPLEAVFRTGRKECVQVTLQDGRTFTCTADHRVLTTAGWVQAGELIASDHRVVVGPDARLDEPSADIEAEQGFRAAFGAFEFTMATPEARGRTLAFFRLVRAAGSDGTFSLEQATGAGKVRLYFGTRYELRCGPSTTSPSC